MADVIVDQKPIDKLPYDPTDIPEAVRKRAAAVDALYQQTSDGAATQTAPSGAPEALPPPPAPVIPSVTAPTAVPTAPAVEDENSNTWKSRALSKEGRERAALEQAYKDLGELQNQLTQLGTELMHAQNVRRQRPRPQAAQMPNYLTAADEQNYGNELLDLTQRAALQVVQPKLMELEAQNAELRRRQAQDQRRVLDQQVEIAVPDFREIDRNPRWHRWLLGVDVLSGRVRQTLLNEAISAGAAPRVISFFKGFKQEEAATGHIETGPSSQPAYAPRDPAVNLASLASPGRARSATGGETSLPPEKPYYTRAQIAQLYRQHQKGAYVGREADWHRLELDIIAAGNEGRIR
jgi:hypothetical protein